MIETVGPIDETMRGEVKFGRVEITRGRINAQCVCIRLTALVWTR